MTRCCKCGAFTDPRMLNMCDLCASAEIDLTMSIRKQDVVVYCKKCCRYLSPPDTWVRHRPGSSELLEFVLKKNKSLERVNVTAASFEYTESHSKRLLVSISVGANGIEQSCLLKIRIKNAQCRDCEKLEAKQYWQSKVQVRQKVKHKRTFMYLEQLMLKTNAHGDATEISEAGDGLDFCYKTRAEAIKFVEFLQGVIGVRVKASSKLVSQDVKSNISFFKDTFSVELFPVCKDDLLCLSQQLAAKLSMGCIAIVLKVTTTVKIIDPVTLRILDVSGKCYWANEEHIRVLASSPQLRRYMVIEMEAARQTNMGYRLADVFVSREGDRTSHSKSHLGDAIAEGDVVLGYDLSVLNSPLEAKSEFEVFLVRKEVKRQRKPRIRTRADRDREYSMFVEDVVQDAELAANIDIYDEEKGTLMSIKDMGI